MTKNIDKPYIRKNGETHSMLKQNKQRSITIITIMALLSCTLITACTKQKTAPAKDAETITEEENSTVYDGLVENPQPNAEENTYDTLNVATYITKADDIYFIADCYHDQIIYSDTLEKPLTEWRVLTNDVHYAHTIAFDGTTLLIDDTENNRLLAFQKIGKNYVNTQILDEIGMKPHFVQYDAKRQVFMAWSSITGELYLVKRAKTPNEQGIYPLYIEDILKIDELYGVYVRSFTLMDDTIYFVSGHNNQKLLKADIVEQDNKIRLEITARYDVPDKLAGMVQLYKIQDYYYITISTDNTENQDYATIIRTKNLDGLKTGDYEELYADFGLSGGTPYYINEIEGRYYMTHHRTDENIIAFDVIDNTIENVAVVY